MDLHAVVICYDVTDKASWQKVDFWLKEILDNGYDELLIFLCGLKIDKGPGKRVVKERDVAQYARSKKVGFMEVSAKTGEKVKDLFVTIAKKVL